MDKNATPIIPLGKLSQYLQPKQTTPPTAKPAIEVKPKYPYKGNTSLVVVLYIYPKCNARCDYCFWFRDFDIIEPMTEAKYKRALDEIAKNPKSHVVLLGGEPSVYKQLPELLIYALDVGIKEINITTNFLRPNSFFYALPRLEKVGVSITVHPDIFKDKTDEQWNAYIDKIIEFAENKPGVRCRIGVVLDNRYVDRLMVLLERIKHLHLMKYPVLTTHETYDYYEISQETVDKVKPYFHEAFRKYTINGEEHDLLDDAVHNGPSFEGYWCNLNTVEVFSNGRVATTCTDSYVGNIFEQDDLIKDYKSLHRCTVPLCDNFNRVLLKKKKYGKYT